MGYDQKKYEYSTKTFLKDMRPVYVRVMDWLVQRDISLIFYGLGIALIGFMPIFLYYIDLIFFIYLLFTWWIMTRDRSLLMKLPMGSPYKDSNNMGPGKSGQAEGIMFFGNDKETDQELWMTG